MIRRPPRSTLFPTRRSSDLCDVQSEDGELIEEAPRTVLKRQIARAAQAGYTVKTAAELELYCFRESFEAARADRKSTRLNSSHLVISYAVFCLKKNNISYTH